MYCVHYVPIFSHYMHPIEFWNFGIFPKIHKYSQTNHNGAPYVQIGHERPTLIQYVLIYFNTHQHLSIDVLVN